MSTIHAYTETGYSYPGYVNLSECDPGVFSLTIRSQGDGGHNVGIIHLTREQLLNLVNDAAEYLDGVVAEHPEQAAKSEAIAADREADYKRWRAGMLDMALRTPGLADHNDVLKAAAAYQLHIEGEKLDTPAPSERVQALEALVRSACAIAERQGAGTAWDRFIASAMDLGLNGVTARTYRVLPSDEQ